MNEFHNTIERSQPKYMLYFITQKQAKLVYLSGVEKVSDWERSHWGLLLC